MQPSFASCSCTHPAVRLVGAKHMDKPHGLNNQCTGDFKIGLVQCLLDFLLCRSHAQCMALGNIMAQNALLSARSTKRHFLLPAHSLRTLWLNHRTFLNSKGGKASMKLRGGKFKIRQRGT